ncbi:helix-turn-helix domain-containing protein [Catenuloplanes japonicus]|uniref:helix-turn-helix domain-containing protein n=1 Tax=Catenuloplanes japonicus TaxID=33876 RepID=UPI000689469D|nr:helix-turn-helix transcriptional regulator [Catenuloplanes japonicus]
MATTTTVSGSTSGVLTSRQHEILVLIADGCDNAEIGRRLHLSEGTVKNYSRVAFGRLGAVNRAHAVAIWGRRQLQLAAAARRRYADNLDPASAVGQHADREADALELAVRILAGGEL